MALLQFLEGRVVAVGIPGVSAVAPVGTFLPGGPNPTKFAAYGRPGQVLDPKRILVGSTHMRQDGTGIARRQVRMAGGQPLGALQLNGMPSHRMEARSGSH